MSLKREGVRRKESARSDVFREVGDKGMWEEVGRQGKR